MYYLFKDETVCKTNSFIYASLFDDRTALQSHYINILIFFYFHVWIDQYQDDDVWINVKMIQKKIYLWKIWQINILDIWMQNQAYDGKKSLEEEKQYTCS